MAWGVASCGSGLSGNLVDARDDGGRPDTAGTEIVSSGPCDPSQDFGTPMLVPGLNSVSANVASAQFSSDELTAYFGMFHGDQLDIYTATRASRSDPFAKYIPISDVNSLASDYAPSVTADGLTLYMNSTRSGAYALYASTRESAASAFSTPSELTELDVRGEGNPFVTPDGGALYFHSTRNGNFDVFRARKTGIGFETPELLPFDSDLDEAAPVASADDLTIYYMSMRNPGANDGIWMATRQSVDQPFGTGVPVKGLTGKSPPLQPLWISPDGCRLYIQDRDANDGYLVVVVERPPANQHDR